MSSYTVYKPLIKAKLEALEETTGVLLFSEVKYGKEGEFVGFPSVRFFKKAGSGKIQDTHSNEREWQFTMWLIYQFGGNKTNEEVEEILDNVVDKVLNSFDTDIDLGGSCKSIQVVPVQFSDIFLEEPFIFAEFTISIVDLVSRN